MCVVGLNTDSYNSDSVVLRFCECEEEGGVSCIARVNPVFWI